MTRIILAVFLALFATICRADITVTGRNGGPPLIYGTHYDIQQFADDSYFVRILQYYDTIPTNQYNIFIGDGNVIQLLQVSVPYSGGSGWNVSLDIDPESGATSGQLDAVTTPTQEPVQLNVFVRGNIGSLDATEIGTIRAQSGNVLGRVPWPQLWVAMIRSTDGCRSWSRRAVTMAPWPALLMKKAGGDSHPAIEEGGRGRPSH